MANEFQWNWKGDFWRCLFIAIFSVIFFIPLNLYKIFYRFIDKTVGMEQFKDITIGVLGYVLIIALGCFFAWLGRFFPKNMLLFIGLSILIPLATCFVLSQKCYESFTYIGLKRVRIILTSLSAYFSFVMFFQCESINDQIKLSTSWGMWGIDIAEILILGILLVLPMITWHIVKIAITRRHIERKQTSNGEYIETHKSKH